MKINILFAECVDYILQASKGLRYLDNKKIIHRDFKPRNLLVQGDLYNITIKVADFDGLYLIKETISATVTSYHMKGKTLSYVAPVICANHILTPSYACDVYSWPITAYEILAKVSSPWECSGKLERRNTFSRIVK